MALRELLAKFDVKVDGAGALKRVNASFDSAKKGATGLLPTLLSLKGAFAALAAGGIGLATKAVIGWVTELTQAVDPIGKLATSAGLATSEIQAWNIVAGEAGAGAIDIQMAFKSLGRVVTGAAGGNKAYADTLKLIGLEGKALAELPLDQQLKEVAVALANVESEGTKLATAQALLEEGGIKLIPAFKGTREEMQAALERAKELSGIFSEEFIRAAEATNDELGRMKNQWLVFKSTIVMAILPALRQVNEWLRAGFNAVTKFARETGIMSRAFTLSGIAGFAALISKLVANFRAAWSIASRFIGVILRFARVLAPWLAWALILDDIVVFLQGGDSALGRLLDKLFGAGTSQTVLEYIKEGAKVAWGALQELIKTAGELWTLLKDSGAAAVLKDVLSAALLVIIEIVKILFQDIAAIGLLFAWLAAPAGEASEKIEAAFLKATEGIGAAFDSLFDGIAGAASVAWENIKAGAAAAVNALSWPIRAVAKLLGASEDFMRVDWGRFGGAPDAPKPTRPGAPARAGDVRGGDANVTVNLTGNPTKETVQMTTAQAKQAAADLLGVSNKQIANAAFRGYYD